MPVLFITIYTMSIKLSANGRPVLFTSFVPADETYDLLYRSHHSYHQGDYGSLFSQHLSAGDSQLLYVQIRLLSSLILDVRYPRPLFVLYLGFEQGIQISSGSGERHSLRANSVTVFYASSTHWSVSCPSTPRGQFMLLVYPPSFAVQQLAFYPSLESARQRMIQDPSFVIPNAVYPMPASLSQLLYQLLYMPLSPNMNAELVLRVLAEVFRRMSCQPPPKPSFPLSDVEGVIAARQWIDAHLERHYTIPQIARKTGMNEYQLKAGFKQFYGVGLYRYLLNQRLLMARIQLEETRKSIRQIARLAGYRSATNFSTAFKRVFDVTPKQWRKGK